MPIFWSLGQYLPQPRTAAKITGDGQNGVKFTDFKAFLANITKACLPSLIPLQVGGTAFRGWKYKSAFFMAGRQRSFSTARVLKTSLGLDGAISTNFRLSWVIVLLVITKRRQKRKGKASFFL